MQYGSPCQKKEGLLACVLFEQLSNLTPFKMGAQSHRQRFPVALYKQRQISLSGKNLFNLKMLVECLSRRRLSLNCLQPFVCRLTFGPSCTWYTSSPLAELLHEKSLFLILHFDMMLGPELTDIKRYMRFVLLNLPAPWCVCSQPATRQMLLQHAIKNKQL